MIRIDPHMVAVAKEAKSVETLYGVLGQALRLEFATIPPYLAASYSLRPGFNARIRGAIRSVVMEEMLHMAIVANVLNALGGRPAMDDPAFVPSYPTTLPMSIGDDLVVGIQKFSKELVRDVFMKIEEPETRLVFPGAENAKFDGMQFATIGEFYRAIMQSIETLGAPAFTGDPQRQVVVVSGFPEHELFAITDPDTAIRALRIVVEDGEGTTSGPLDHENEPAHYYRFEEIVRGRKLRRDTSVPEGFSFTGADLPFEAAGVADFPDNPKAAHYPQGTPGRDRVDAFNRLYSDLVRDLQRTFDGDPAHIRVAIQTMEALDLVARDLVAATDGNGRPLGPPFEFLP